MSDNKVQFPGPGCLVEFMQGNNPMQAIVLEEQKGKLRLYAANRREINLQSSRLLPWTGPDLGQGLSRQRMDESLEERRTLRASIASALSPLEVWELTQGEVQKATSEWLAGLLWVRPTVDQEAALGNVLLAAKTHFRFTPPEFEIFSQEVVDQRLAEAESARIRDAFAVTGAQFFQKLWEVHTRKRAPLSSQEIPEEPLAEKLKELVFSRIADPDENEGAAIWKLLVKGLPDVPHIALSLAVAWGLVPEHYNFWLDRAGYERGEGWAAAFDEECKKIIEDASNALAPLTPDATPFASIDPASTTDRDDAFYVEQAEDGSYTVKVALACPALVWPFGSELDKTVARRATSLYLPEGDEHMLPSRIGRGLFSLDSGKARPAFVLTLALSAEGEVRSATPQLAAVSNLTNLDLETSESALRAGEFDRVPAMSVPGKARAHIEMLRHALGLARLLQQNRIAQGAVITERPDPEISIEGEGVAARVRIDSGVEAPLSHLLVGELMVLANASLALWGKEHGIPLLYRTQDVALPREFSGIWTQPHEISRVVRALPPASLESTPKKHAGLGLSAYATFSSPIRRYTDLFNQGQAVSFIQNGAARVSQAELTSLLSLFSARADAVMQVQRQRPRYWKLLFFRQHGDKKWWDAVVSDENEAFATISLPWAHLMVRGKRRQFDEKFDPGMAVKVRIGKVNPLLGEIQVLEAQER